MTIRQRGVVVAEARFDDRLTLFTAEGGTIVNGYVGEALVGLEVVASRATTTRLGGDDDHAVSGT